MKRYIEDKLSEVERELDDFEICHNNIIEDSRKIIIKIKTIMDDLKSKITDYCFESKEDEILFFKEQKPKILSEILFFNKLYQIESKFPNGSVKIAVDYIDKELHSLNYFFNKNIDFYQYYRSKSTLCDDFYFIRGKNDIYLANDSSYFNSDPKFSTGYDYKVAKILANDMLEVYLKKRLQMVERNELAKIEGITLNNSQISWTGSKIAVIELGYAIYAAGVLNNGNADIKQIMTFIENSFNIDLGDYYRAYLSMRERKKDRTPFLNNLALKLLRKMDDDDTY